MDGAMLDSALAHLEFKSGLQSGVCPARTKVRAGPRFLAVLHVVIHEEFVRMRT